MRLYHLEYGEAAIIVAVNIPFVIMGAFQLIKLLH
jgi:hypothetical protein